MSDKEPITAAHLYHVFSTPNEVDANGEEANVADGLFAIARALDSVARSLKDLGNRNASTQMGATEALSTQVLKGFGAVALPDPERSRLRLSVTKAATAWPTIILTCTAPPRGEENSLSRLP